MAFTAAHIDSIMGFLGYPTNADQVTKFTALANAVTAASASAETRVIGYLTRLTAIQAQIDTAVNAVGSPYDQLKTEAQRYCYLISNSLGMEIKQKVFK